MSEFTGYITKQERKKKAGIGFVTYVWVGDDLIRICPAVNGVRSICFHRHDPELSNILGYPATSIKSSMTIKSKDSLKTIINDINIGYIPF